MSRELSAIVGYFDQLRASADAIDPPTLQGVSLQDGLRDDAIRPSFDAATALTNAPRREGVFFRVPKVLDTEGGG